MKLRARLLAELIEERFPAAAIETERVEYAEPTTVQLARVIQARIEASSWESDAERAARLAELLTWPNVPAEVIAAVPDRRRPSTLIGKPRAGMDPLTLAAVRAADRDRRRTQRAS